jgi:hypothetical protein
MHASLRERQGDYISLAQVCSDFIMDRYICALSECSAIILMLIVPGELIVNQFEHDSYHVKPRAELSRANRVHKTPGRKEKSLYNNFFPPCVHP